MIPIIVDLSTKEGLAIASAVRGPDTSDIDAFRYKEVTTSVLRYMCGVSENYCIVVSPRMAKERWDNYSRPLRVAVIHSVHGHTKEHLYDAFTAVGTDEAIAYRNWLVEQGLLPSGTYTNPPQKKN